MELGGRRRREEEEGEEEKGRRIQGGYSGNTVRVQLGTVRIQ